MSSALVRGQVVEVPLPSDFANQQCLPLVVLVPQSNLNTYMLTTVFAINGSPGIVDHAILADTATNVEWSGILDAPTIGDMLAADFASNGAPGVVDEAVLAETVSFEAFGEGIVTISAGSLTGAILLTNTILNPANAVYTPTLAFLYDCSQSPAPHGTLHFEIFDTDTSTWIIATSPQDISALNTGKTAQIRVTTFLTAANRTFECGVQAMQWRVVLDTAPGVAITLKAGMRFSVYAASALV